MENRLWKQIGLDKRKWEPFAEQVCSLSDEEIIPLIPDMLEWLQDMNWPGAVLYAKRLRTLPEEVVYPVVERTISQAKMMKSGWRIFRIGSTASDIDSKSPSMSWNADRTWGWHKEVQLWRVK